MQVRVHFVHFDPRVVNNFNALWYSSLVSSYHRLSTRNWFLWFLSRTTFLLDKQTRGYTGTKTVLTAAVAIGCYRTNRYHQELLLWCIQLCYFCFWNANDWFVFIIRTLWLKIWLIESPTLLTTWRKISTTRQFDILLLNRQFC